jgi:hypothetical protein
MKQLFLHIGTLKTGSTSIQGYLEDHIKQLEDQGFSLYEGAHMPVNHIELFLAAMRYERDSFAKLKLQNRFAFDESYTESIRQRVNRFIDTNPCQKVILTTEGLCLLRYDDEVDRLKSILGESASNTTIILYLRNKADYLKSYTRQLLKVRGRLPSDDPESSLYVEEDSWLWDYESLIALFARGFGSENVKVIDYDQEKQSRGNVLPSFLEAIGYRGEEDYDEYFLNCN